MGPVLSWFALGGLTWIPIAHSDEQMLEEITIIGRSVELDSVSGSAYVIDEEDLDRFDYVYLRKVLNQAPGVYIR